jgi:hypothetical protein
VCCTGAARAHSAAGLHLRSPLARAARALRCGRLLYPANWKRPIHAPFPAVCLRRVLERPSWLCCTWRRLSQHVGVRTRGALERSDERRIPNAAGYGRRKGTQGLPKEEAEEREARCALSGDIEPLNSCSADRDWLLSLAQPRKILISPIRLVRVVLS